MKQVLAAANGSATLILPFTFDLLKGPRYRLIPFAQYVLSFNLSTRSGLMDREGGLCSFSGFPCGDPVSALRSPSPYTALSVFPKFLPADFLNVGLKFVPTRTHTRIFNQYLHVDLGNSFRAHVKFHFQMRC